jgi:hypothetical protein
LNLDLPEGVDYFWTTRMVSPSELNFMEVRRLHLYNVGKDKKNFKVKLRDKTSLIKITKEYNGKVKTKEQSFEAEIGPSGSLGMDFGIWP